MADMTTMEDWDRARRWGSSAGTWLGKAAALIVAIHESDPPEAAASIEWDAGALMTKALGDLEVLAAALGTDDDRLADAEEAAKRLVSALRRRRLAAKLANVHGRTPEEAASFAAKVEEFSR